MKFMTTKEAVELWGISERRVRQLLNEGRIDGAVKLGNSWDIPVTAQKPIDRRSTKIRKNDFTVNLDHSAFKELDALRDKVNKKRPFPLESFKKIKEQIALEWTYHSNGLEGNPLTLEEAETISNGYVIPGRTFREHLEIFNHEKAVDYVLKLTSEGSKKIVSQKVIKDLHQILLRDIDDENAGQYRRGNVMVKGVQYIPPDYTVVPEKMRQLIMDYNRWNGFHPVAKIAILHGELVRIHPFTDGNSRTARLLMNLELLNQGYVPVIFKKENKYDYYQILDKAHLSADYTEFVKVVIKDEIDMLNKYIKFL